MNIKKAIILTLIMILCSIIFTFNSDQVYPEKNSVEYDYNESKYEENTIKNFSELSDEEMRDLFVEAEAKEETFPLRGNNLISLFQIFLRLVAVICFLVSICKYLFYSKEDKEKLKENLKECIKGCIILVISSYYLEIFKHF